MRVKREAGPILGVEARRIGCERRIRRYGPVTSKHALTQEAVTTGIRGKLEIAVQVAGADPFLETIRNVGDVGQHDDSLNLDSRPQFQANSGDDAEQPVAPDSETEEVGVLLPRARANLTQMVDQLKRLHLLDDRFQCQPAAMSVAGQRSTETEPVRAGLLLIDSPLPLMSFLYVGDVLKELRLLDTAFTLDRPVLGIERPHAVEGTGVDEDARSSELLPAHRMTPTRDGHGRTCGTGFEDRGPNVAKIGRFNDGVDAGRIELRVDVVDECVGLADWNRGPVRQAHGERPGDAAHERQRRKCRPG